MKQDSEITVSPQQLELLGSGHRFRDEFCEMLEHIYNDLEWAEIRDMSSYMKVYRIHAGATLFHEGEDGNYMCTVIAGKVDVHKENWHFENKVVASIEKGKMFGEMSMVDGEPRSATAVIATEAILAILTRKDFKRLVDEKPALGVKILMRVARQLSQRLRRTSGILVDYLEG